MTIVQGWKWVFAAILSSPAWGSPGTEPDLASQGAVVELNRDGLAVVARALESEVLTDIEGMPLPDVEDRISGGIEVELTGIKAWAGFESLALVPKPGVLATSLAVRGARIEVERMRLVRRVLGNPVSLTCHDVTLEFGKGRPLPVRVDLAPAVRSNAFSLRSHGVSFDLDEEDYEVHGPRRCSGRLGLGSVWSAVVNWMLTKARPTLAKEIRGQIEKQIPALGERLDQGLRQSHAIAIEGVPALPDATAVIETYPSSVSVTAEALRLEMGIEIQPGDGTLKAFHGAGKSLVPLGRAGFNPYVLTEGFERLYPNGTLLAEIDEDDVPGLKEVLRVTSAAAIWPDLATVRTGRDHLRLFVRVAEAPQLGVDGNRGTISLTLPRFELVFHAHIGGQWIPYFHMSMALQGALFATVEQEFLDLNFAPEALLEVDGHFDPSYTPAIDIFERDMAEFLLASILDYLYASGPLARMFVPALPIGGQLVTVAEPHVEAPYYMVRLVR